jgi:hypothetical protein
MALVPQGLLRNSLSSGIGFPGEVASRCEPRSALAWLHAVGASFPWAVRASHVPAAVTLYSR